MTPMDDLSLQQILGGIGLPPGLVRAGTRVVLKTVDELFPGKVAPYGVWRTWGSKTAGEVAPPLGDERGIVYMFSGRPARDALVIEAPK